MEPSLRELMNDVAAKVVSWKNFAIQLQLTTVEIDRIDNQERGDTKECFREVFSLWRKKTTPPYTWTTVISALKSPCVSENCVAMELEQKYQTVHNKSVRSSLSLGKHPRGDLDAPIAPLQKQPRQT